MWLGQDRNRGSCTWIWPLPSAVLSSLHLYRATLFWCLLFLSLRVCVSPYLSRVSLVRISGVCGERGMERV